MTSTVAERPAHYDAPNPQAVTTPSRPVSPMNTIGEGATPLMYACQQSRDQDVRNILAKKPDAARERDRTMKTALHYCAESPSLTCADMVLSAAHDLVDARDEDGYTPIHLAVIAGNKPLIKFLLSKNADVNNLDNERHSVVHWATVCGEVDALELVLDAGANPSTPDIHGGYPIHYAAQMCGPNSEMGNDVRFGLAVLRKLLAKGVEVNVRDKDGRQPILWAASAGSADAILALVNAGANVEADDKDGLTALHCAASRGHTDCIETLVTLCGAEVDVIDSNGCTALFYAVTLGHADSTQLLLSFGAEPNRQDRKGRTPAHCGAAKGQLETLRILGTHGANLWVRNVKGDYPLHEAVVSGRKDLVRWLLTQRPDAVNSPNNDGRCPLHIAAINNNVEMCKILLDGQALLNPVMRTSKGQLMTPIDAALHRGNRGCAKYLQLHGGVPASKLTDKSARIRGGNQRGAMSETQSEQYTTPEFAASLSLPGGRNSLGTSPLGDHAAGLNDPARRMDSRTLQVRMNDDVAIRHVERIEAPLICTHRRFDDDSSEEERMRRRRRRRRREHRRSDYVDDLDSEMAEEDLRRRRRGGRRNDGFSDSAENEMRKRRRKRRDDEFSEDWDSETERRNRRRWRRRGDRTVSSERSDDEEQDMADNVSDSNWVRNKKRYGEKMERPQRRSKNKEESENEDSEAEYVRVKRTTIKSKKTRRKTVTDEEQEEHIEESSERGSEVEGEEEVEEDVKKENSEVTTEASKREKVTTTTKTKTKTKDDKSKLKEDSNIVHKVDSRRSKKKEAALDKDTKNKVETSSNKTTESESKILRGNKAKISKKYVTKESSTRRKTEETKDNDTTKKSTKKVIRKGVRQVENDGESKVLDKVVEKTRVEETGKESLQKREAYRQSEAPMSLEEDGVTQTVVTALVHQHEDAGSPEVPHEGEQVESAEKGEAGKKDGSEVVQVTGDVEGKHIIDEARTSSKSEEKTDFGDGGGKEEGDIKPGEGNVETEAKKDDTDGDISKSVDSESRKSRMSVEDERDITKENGEDETKTEETINDEENETEFGVKTGGKAKYENEQDEVNYREIEGEVEACSSERNEAEEVRERRAEAEEEGKLVEEGEWKYKDNCEDDGVVTKKINDFGEEKENSEPKDSKITAKDISELVESRGPQTDKLTQEIKRDVKGSEEGEERAKTDEDSRSSTRDLTMSSSLEKVEGAEREVNGESRESTAPSRNGGDSSVLLDSGFEPSPRRDKDTTTTSGNNQQTRSARVLGGPSRGRGRGRIPRPCRTDDEQPTTVSVTQAVQRSMRKYHLERRIFQELLELKRLQIRAGRANEQVLVKRLVDEYHKAGLTVGMRQYDGVYSFRSFEKYLYDQLRLLQSSDRRLIPRLKSSDDLEKLTAALRRARFNSAYLDDIPDNPILCTHGTHRCHHAAHAYTGIPCAAYVSKLHHNHHHAPKSGHAGSSRSGFLPRIDPSSRGTGRNSSAIPRSLSYVDPSRPVTLELSHGSEKQVISLPTERLDRNKRYYVTFTIKGGPSGSKEDKQAQSAKERTDLRHRHSDSL